MKVVTIPCRISRGVRLVWGKRDRNTYVVVISTLYIDSISQNYTGKHRRHLTFKEKNNSGDADSVTFVTVPLGKTSSNARTVSIVRPYWFVSHE